MPTVATEDRIGRSLNAFTASLLAIYLLFILGMMVLGRASITPDVFGVFALAVAAVFGRARLFLRDWLPFIAILLAWQAMRGFADDAGFPVQSDSVIAIERLLTFGNVPAEALQALLYVPGRTSPLDVSMSIVYLMHFFVTLALALGLWLAHRPTFRVFAVALLVLSVAQFVTAVLVPVAPPRFAFMHGEALAITDIGRVVGDAAGLHTLTWAYVHMNANPVAAFPSLHAAYPVLAFLVVRGRWPKLAAVVAIYGATVWFAIMYLGHHYLVDALGGAAYAWGAYWAVEFALAGGFTVGRLGRLPFPRQRELVPVAADMESDEPEPTYHGRITRT